MSKTDTKNFIKGSAKKITFDNGGSIINLSLNLDELNNLPSTKGYIKISVVERRDEDQYGNTHYVIENAYKADEGKTGTVATNDEDKLPF